MHHWKHSVSNKNGTQKHMITLTLLWFIKWFLWNLWFQLWGAEEATDDTNKTFTNFLVILEHSVKHTLCTSHAGLIPDYKKVVLYIKNLVKIKNMSSCLSIIIEFHTV